jgi:hypothetical protein
MYVLEVWPIPFGGGASQLDENMSLAMFSSEFFYDSAIENIEKNKWNFKIFYEYGKI